MTLRLPRDARHEPRGDRVVAHGLDGVLLHEADVLVRRRVEDDRRAVGLEDLAHALLLLAVREDDVEGGVVHVAVVLELALDREEVVLGVVEEDEPARRDARDLARELLADRAAGAGDEDDLAVEVRADAVELHPHGLAAEDVLDLDVAHLAHRGRAGLQQLEDRRQRAHRDAALAAGAHDVRAHDAGRRRDRDRDLVGLDLLEDPPELGRRAEDLDAVDAQARLERVVVDEADGLEAELGVAQDLAQDEAAAVAGADDEHAARVGAGAEAAQRALVDRARDEARAADEREHEQEEQREHARRGGDGRDALRRPRPS